MDDVVDNLALAAPVVLSPLEEHEVVLDRTREMLSMIMRMRRGQAALALEYLRKVNDSRTD